MRNRLTTAVTESFICARTIQSFALKNLPKPVLKAMLAGILTLSGCYRIVRRVQLPLQQIRFLNTEIFVERRSSNEQTIID